MSQRSSKPAFAIRVQGDEAEILIYQEIDANYGISAKAFREELKAAGDVATIHVRINSPGGSIFDGLAIYSTLKDHKAHKIVTIDGVALSMASAVAMAGDEIEIAENGFVMIHNPVTFAFGDAEEMRKTGELLDKLRDQLIAIYVKRTNLDPAEITALMDAETWFDAREAVEKGFADRTTAELAVAAAFDYSRFHKVPDCLKGNQLMASEPAVNQPTNPASQPAAVPAVASYSEIVSACVGADAEFICEQLKTSATVAQAQSAWMAAQQQRIADATARAAEAEAKASEAAAKAAAKPVGVAPLGTKGDAQSEESGDPIAAFDKAVRERMGRGMERLAACVAVAKANPELHKAYLLATNEGKRTKRLIEEKFE